MLYSMLSSIPFEIPAALQERCGQIDKIRMAVAGADNLIALKSAYQATKANLVDPVLIGNAHKIISLADTIDWNLSGVEIIDTEGEEKASTVAVELAKSSKVAALMKGYVHTDALMKAVLNRRNGLLIGRRLSHVFHMTVPNSERVLMITDGAINVAPNTTTKIDIINNAVQLSHALGNTMPRVAMLSGTETVIESMPSSVDAAEVVKLANNGAVTGAIVDGPFAFDNAVSSEAAKIKGIMSPVAGKADILIVPNIETGNGLFKMMVYFMSGLAAGVVMGAKVPIVLTSRADPPEARFAATAIAVIAANETVDQD